MPSRAPVSFRWYALLVVLVHVWLSPRVAGADLGRKGHLKTWIRSRRSPANGLGFCWTTLGAIARHRHRSRPCVIFDIDNTLVDTRRRTLAAAHAFGRRGGPELSLLARATIDQVGWDGTQTGKKLGLHRGTTRAFQRYWDDFFWTSRNLKLDTAIRQTVQLARLAKAAGAEVLYLTGRIEDLKPGTIHQLRKLGLPDVDGSHVICKPSLKVKTATFKQEVVRRLERNGNRICWFMSDSRSDIAAIQQRTAVPCVWIDFPVQPDGRAPRIAPATPTIRIR